MAKRKRDDNGIDTPSSKRKRAKQKGALEDLPGDYWPIVDVRGEKRVGNEIHYLVEWAPHPHSGLQYPLEWKPSDDVNEEAVHAWKNYKKQQRKRGLAANEQYFVRSSYCETAPGQAPRTTVRRVILSSPTTDSDSTTQESAYNSSFVELDGTQLLSQTGSFSPEVPETQSEHDPSTNSVHVVITPLRPSQRNSFVSLPDYLPSSGSESIESGAEESFNISLTPEASLCSPSLSHSIRVNHSSLPLDREENTIPDSQSQDRVSSIDSRPFNRSSEPQFAAGGLPPPRSISTSVEGDPVAEIQHYITAAHLSSPLTSSSESELFEGRRSSRAESVSTDVASDSEILSHSQPGTLSNSAPSAQLEPLPSFGTEPSLSEGFQTQIPTFLTGGGNTPSVQAHTSLFSLEPGIVDHTGSAAALRSEPRIEILRHERRQRQSNSEKSQSNQSPINSPLTSFIHCRQTSSMARNSRESTPQNSRASPAVSQVVGTTLQERLRNMRAPAKAVAEARKKDSSAHLSPSQAAEAEGGGEDQKHTSTVSDFTDSNNVLQSTEHSTDTEIDSAENETNSVSATQTAAQASTEENRFRARTPLHKHSHTASTEKKPVMFPILTPLEYVVPLPVEGKMRDLYLEAIKLKEKDVSQFLSSDKKPSPNLMDRMTSFIEQLSLTTAHTDYVIQQSLTQSDIPASQEATWDDYASTKYAFLGHVLDVLRHMKINIHIVAGTDQVRRGLVTYCAGKKIGCVAHEAELLSHSTSYEPDDPLRVFVSSSLGDIAVPLDLIIVFEYLDVHNGVQERPHTQDGKTIPLIHLAVKNSPEHAALCLSKDIPPSEVLKALVKEVVASRRLLGKVDYGDEADFSHFSDYNQRIQAMKRDYNAKIMMHAKAVAQCLSDEDFDAGWPFPPVPFDLVPNFQPPPLPPSARNASPVPSRTGTPSGQKRGLDVLDGSGAKRQRLTPLHDVTHISDSLNDPQSQVDAIREELRKTQLLLNQEREKSAIEIATLKTSLTSAEVHLQETTTELGKLQYRYETRTREVHTMRRQIKNLESEKASEAVRRAKLIADNDALKEGKRTLQAELTAARTALKEGGGTTGELEVAREQVRQLEKEKSTLERQYGNIKKDFEFTRQQYQNASTAAAESVSQVREFEREIADLKVAASDEKRRLKETNFANDRERYLNHIAQEEANAVSLNSQLQRKEEELRTVRRGRGVQTRASSAQPGSPRLGAMGPGSRGSSPVAGYLSVGRMSALRHER